MSSKFLVLVVLCLLISVVSCGWLSPVYTARMDGNQQSPSIGSKVSLGVVVCVLARHTEPKTLDCEVSHSVPLATVTQIQIQKGRRTSVDTNILYSFSDINLPQFRQVFDLEDIVTAVVNVNPKPGEPAFFTETYTVDDQVDDFLNGLWFVDVWSSSYPTGEIRGQLEHSFRLYSRLENDGRVNAGGAISNAQGLAVASYTELDPRREVIMYLVHNVEEATGVQITRGPATDVGHSVVYEFENVFSPVTEHYTISASAEHDMFLDGHHVNVLSTSDPNTGEIRGELNTIDYLPQGEVSFTASLNGRNVVPLVSTAARGCALVTVDCTSRLMEYLIVHTARETIAGNLNQGVEGERGRQVFPLVAHASPIYGSRVLDVGDFLDLITENLFFSIHTSLYPGGEIRGQITAQRDWAAYLTGTNMPEPVTTSAVGCATFQIFLERGDYVLNYDITTTVKRPAVVSIQKGVEFQEGTNTMVSWGEMAGRLPPTLSGDDEELDDDDYQAWLTQRAFVQVDSDDYPQGEIRGQVFRINPCNAASPPATSGGPYLPPLLPPPPPPSPRDPFVIATVTIDNTTVEIRIGNLKNFGAGSVLSSSLSLLCALIVLTIVIIY